jgi:hypothetical protein
MHGSSVSKAVMEAERAQLISLLVGDLDRDEALQLEARFAGDTDLQARHEALRRQVIAIRALPGDDVPQAAVDRLLAAARDFHEEPEAVQLARVISLRAFFSVYLPRVAAAALFAGLVGLAVAYLPEGPSPGVGNVIVDGLPMVVADGELVSARLGEPLQIKTSGAEILVDGGAAVRLHSQGPFTAPNIEIDRGRVVIDATRGATMVQAGSQALSLERGSVISVERDREYAQIQDSGTVVEIQRTTIEGVLEEARRAYGLNLDGSALPDAVARQRVTFYATQLDADGFKRTFEEAAGQYGVRLMGNRLVYMPGTTLRVAATDEAEVLNLNLLQGRVNVTGERRLNLGGRDGLASVSLWSSGRVIEGESGPERSCTWARGMGNAVVEAKLSDVRLGESTLPAGTVIHPRKLILPEGEERIFLLEGNDFNFPLPGGHKGRLIALISSGAEFQLEGSATRVFVPHSRVVTRD